MSHLGARTAGSFFLTEPKNLHPHPQFPFKAPINVCKNRIHAAFRENKTRHPVQSLQLFSTRILEQNMALSTWTAHPTNPRCNWSKKNPCSLQCLYYIFVSHLHIWGIEMLKAVWLDFLKAPIHFPPCNTGPFQVPDKQQTTMPF